MLTEAQNLLLKSFSRICSFMRHRRLNYFAWPRILRRRTWTIPDGSLPKEVAAVLYASISAALLRLDERISLNSKTPIWRRNLQLAQGPAVGQ